MIISFETGGWNDRSGGYYLIVDAFKEGCSCRLQAWKFLTYASAEAAEDGNSAMNYCGKYPCGPQFLGIFLHLTAAFKFRERG